MGREISDKLSLDGSEVYVPTSTGKGLELKLTSTGGEVDTLEVLQGGTGYTNLTPITVVHNTGTGCTARINGVGAGGVVTGIEVLTVGEEYYTEGLLRQANTIMCTLVDMDWMDLTTGESKPIRLASGSANIVWYHDKTDYTDYKVFQAIGLLGSIDTVEEGFDLQSYGISMTLSGIPKQYREEAFSDAQFTTAFQNRPCTIYTAFLNSAHEIVGEPILIFRGQMDGCQLSMGDNIEMTLGVQSRLINWEIPRGGRYNTHDQQVWYPEDTGFDLIPTLLNKELEWGGNGSSNWSNVYGGRSYSGGGILSRGGDAYVTP